MSLNHSLETGNTTKTDCDRAMKEVKDLMRRRDNMVSRIASVYDGHKKHQLAKMKSNWVL